MPDQSSLNKIYELYGPYGYIPSEVGAIIFTIVFGLLTLSHTFQAVHSKHYFMLVVAFGAFCECVGNGIRIYGHFHAQVVDPYIAQQVSSPWKKFEEFHTQSPQNVDLLKTSFHPFRFY